MVEFNEPDRIKKRIILAREKDFPSELHIDVTNHCNKKCYMCPMRDRYKRHIFPMGYMNMDLYKRIIDECNEYHGGQMEVNLHKDGEPLMHQQIEEMIRYAKSYGMRVHFATNGILLRKKKKEICDSGLDLLTVSTIGEEAFSAISDFCKYKGKGNLPFTQIKLFDKNVKGVTGWYPTPADHPINKWQKECEADLIFVFTGWHEWSDAKEFTAKDACQKIIYGAAITWEGYFQLCCIDYKRDMVFGNVKDASIKDLWKKVQEVYRKQQIGIWEKPCLTCDYYQRLKNGAKEDKTKIKIYGKKNLWKWQQ